MKTTHCVSEESQHRHYPVQTKMTALLAPGFGISILPNDEIIRTFGMFKYIYVFAEGVHIPENLILHETASDHYSLEPALPSRRNRISGSTGVSLIFVLHRGCGSKFLESSALVRRG